jgi:hypothetical protein
MALLPNSAEFVIPKFQAELRHGHRDSGGRAQPGEPIEDGGADL